ncbi:hypothetical protein [Nocardia sp. CA-120079]|uniref:hypothetical protein n=1 Tax=Nocardia sp. CA-120079 TaxID=3239974 RepID=UPI003D98F862
MNRNNNRTPTTLRRAGIVAAALVVSLLLSTGVAEAATVVAAGQNPFDGVVPDFNVFGAEFNNAWKKLLGAVWAGSFILAGFGLISSFVDLQRAKKGGYSGTVADKTESVKTSIAQLLGLSAVGIIVGGIISIF